MADFPYHQQSQSARPSFHYRDDPHQQTLCTHVTKAAIALTAGGSLLVLAALMLTATVISLTIVTPLFFIFSPGDRKQRKEYTNDDSGNVAFGGDIQEVFNIQEL
ncbi:Oleosin protein [Vigna angularis]|uniref:Oleosin protein n=2 Tax=Phaseolus angularis TaxID=3914 RepID=A0A8T0KHV5_PHAAN|nr:Oleosin protein [Vigna angularis]BAT90601.1 hypothetical protein VIGAN_06186800 [Vigna angularis var. angularis]